MGRCASCPYVQHEQYRGYRGFWSCIHPFRSELDNKGHFTFPKNHNPNVCICETSIVDFGNDVAHLVSLEEAKTPRWCYFEAVERAKKNQPGFDPDVQRKILYE